MKRVLTFLLSVCILFSVMPLFATQASAADFDYSGWLWPVKATNAPADASNRNLYCKIMYRGFYDGHTALDISDYTGYTYAIRASKSGTVTTVYTGCVNYNGAADWGSSCDNVGCNPLKNGAPCYDRAYYNGKAFCGFGNGVIILHDNGATQSQYAHLSSVTVSPGQYVQQGQIIGYMGSTGASTGPHLHFAIKHNYGSGFVSVNNNPIGDVLLKSDGWNGVDTILYADEPSDISVVSPINLGDSFYASISRADSPGELLSVTDSMGGSATFAAAADQSDLQRWQFIRQSDGSYQIRSVHSGYVLNVDNGSSAEGTLANIWMDLGNIHQQWYIYEIDNGYRIASKSNSKSLTIYPANSGLFGALYSHNGSAEQTLKIHVHNYQETDVPANCLTGGYTLYDCTGCDDFYTVGDGTAASGHSYAVSGYVDATCQELGAVIYTCQNCGDSYTEQTETVWSDWTETLPDGLGGSQIESRTQYRYCDRESNWAQTESAAVDYVASWPSGFYTGNSLYAQYHNTPMTDSETATRKVTVTSNDVIGYINYHWCRGYAYGPINRRINNCNDGTYTYFHAFFTTSAGSAYDASGAYGEGAMYYYNADCCRDTYWYLQIPVYRQSYTVQELQFSGERWTDWSTWSDDAVAATDTRKVETRTLYRYAAEGLGAHSWADGVCSLCGAAKPEDPILMGDVNSDGTVDNVDAMMILQYTVGILMDHELLLPAADVSTDGSVDNVDAMMILQYSVGLIKSFQ